MKEKLKVLLVDADAVRANNLKKFLTTEGFCIYAILNNFKDVVVSVSINLPDIVVLDMELDDTGKRGLDIAQYLHTEYAIPFIMMINYSNYSHLTEMIDTMPCSSVIKSETNYNQQVLNAIKFSRPFRTAASQKQLLIQLKAKEIDLDKDGKPIWKNANNKQYCLTNILISNILFITSNNVEDKNTVQLWFMNEHEHCLQLRGTLDNILLLLSVNYLIRIHNSFIVNSNFVSKLHLPHSLFINKHELPVGFHFLESVQKNLREKFDNLKI